MKVAVIGSRGLTVENLKDYLPKETTEIVSGGAKGIDTGAKNYANASISFRRFFGISSAYAMFSSACVSLAAL